MVTVLLSVEHVVTEACDWKKTLASSTTNPGLVRNLISDMKV